MKRFRVTINLTETYDVIVDARDLEDGWDAAHELTNDEVRQGDFQGGDMEVRDIEETEFIRED